MWALGFLNEKKEVLLVAEDLGTLKGDIVSSPFLFATREEAQEKANSLMREKGFACSVVRAEPKDIPLGRLLRVKFKNAYGWHVEEGQADTVTAALLSLQEQGLLTVVLHDEACADYMRENEK